MGIDSVSDNDKAKAAWANNVRAALGDGNPAQGASYVIFYDSSDSKYKARDGTDGKIDYSGTSGSVVIQAAIDSLTSGGSIFLRRKIGASYALASGLTVGNEVRLTGELITHQGGNMTYGTYLTLNNNVDEDIITNKDHTNGNTGITIENMILSGNKANQASGNGIRFVGTDGNFVKGYLIRNVMVRDCKEDCVQFTYCGVGNVIFNRLIESDKSGFRASYSTDWNFQSNDVGSLGEDGLTISNGGGRIINNKLYVSRYGINTASTCIIGNNYLNDIEQHGIVLLDVMDCPVTGNFLFNVGTDAADTYQAINLGNSTYCTITGNVIQGENVSKYGIAEGASADYNTIIGNSIRQVGTQEIYKQGAHTIVKHNIGWVTENSGTATIGNGTETTGNIAHGLANTPTVVFANGTTTDTEDLYCDSKDATNIVIKCVGAVGGDRTIYWKAEV